MGILLRIIYFTVVIGGLAHAPHNVLAAMQSQIGNVLPSMPTVAYANMKYGINAACKGLDDIIAQANRTGDKNAVDAIKLYRGVMQGAANHLNASQSCTS